MREHRVVELRLGDAVARACFFARTGERAAIVVAVALAGHFERIRCAARATSDETGEQHGARRSAARAPLRVTLGAHRLRHVEELAIDDGIQFSGTHSVRGLRCPVR